MTEDIGLDLAPGTPDLSYPPDLDFFLLCPPAPEACLPDIAATVDWFVCALLFAEPCWAVLVEEVD